MNRRDVARMIGEECDRLKAVLLEKNALYGNSVFDPVGIMARGIDPEIALRVRIDDKLSRMARGEGDDHEDNELDLRGYLTLLAVWRRLRLTVDTPLDSSAETSGTSGGNQAATKAGGA